MDARTKFALLILAAVIGFGVWQKHQAGEFPFPWESGSTPAADTSPAATGSPGGPIGLPGTPAETPTDTPLETATPPDTETPFSPERPTASIPPPPTLEATTEPPVQEMPTAPPPMLTEKPERPTPPPYTEPPAAGKYLCPASNLRLLTTRDVTGKSTYQLYLMRNEIFARHGRPFKRADLQEYFHSQSWYQVNPNYTDALLSPVEQRNVAFILKRERALGSPYI